MPAITPNSRIPFGNRGRFGIRGRKLRDLSDTCLRWIIDNGDRDPMAAYAPAAMDVLTSRAANEKTWQQEDDLDAQADAILRRAGRAYLCRKA